MLSVSPARASRVVAASGFSRALDRHQFFFGRGVFSDDTEHACLTAQALLMSGGDATRFARDLARRLRWWFLGLPAGIGRATLRACLRLWVGFAAGAVGCLRQATGRPCEPRFSVCAWATTSHDWASFYEHRPA